MVTVTDMDSARLQGTAYFEEEGFAFQFPMVVWMSSNVPRKDVERIEPIINVENIFSWASAFFYFDKLIIFNTVQTSFSCDGDIAEMETEIAEIAVSYFFPLAIKFI